MRLKEGEIRKQTEKNKKNRKTEEKRAALYARGSYYMCGAQNEKKQKKRDAEFNIIKKAFPPPCIFCYAHRASFF